MKRSPAFVIAVVWFLLLTLPVVGGDKGDKDKEVSWIAEMKFVKVPKGTFWMGGGNGAPGNLQVEIKADYQLAAYTVTQKQWETIMGDNPSWHSRKGDGKKRAALKDVPDADLKRFPVEMVSWEDVQAFVKKVNERQKGKGWLYRLPTEAEWEYACRSAATSKEECSWSFYLDKPSNDLSSTAANINGMFPAGAAKKGPWLDRPTKVGSYAPNKLGLYDMHGNVWQFCEDKVSEGAKRVYRGGCWAHGGLLCEAAIRMEVAPSYRSSDVGFRLVRVSSDSK
jgi:formylglycine-generating enzyme required for sulfatase activity